VYQNTLSTTNFSPRPLVPPLPPDPLDEAYLEEATKEEWSHGVTHFSEAIRISSPSLIVPCSVRGITVEAHCNPIMEVNILPWLLAETLLGNVMLAPSDILLKSCPSGHVFECRGIARAMPLIIDGIKAILDFHIFDVLDLDLLLGSPVKTFLDISLGSLDHKLRKLASTTSIIGPGPLLVKPLPKQDPLEKMVHVSPFTLPESFLIEVVDFSTPNENDSEGSLHFYEG
jgi:hypothetical protein